MDYSVILLSEIVEQMSSASVGGYESPATMRVEKKEESKKEPISKMAKGNSPRRYEDPAKKNRRLALERRKPGIAAWISRRYGCDNLPEHHSRSRCMIQGRISQIRLALEKTADPVQRFKLQSKLRTWNRKMTDEIRRSRFRKH